MACDASSYSLVAVLSHVMDDGRERPVAYASRTLTPNERNYAQIEREALCIVYGVKKIHKFLYGRKFTLITDHEQRLFWALRLQFPLWQLPACNDGPLFSLLMIIVLNTEGRSNIVTVMRSPDYPMKTPRLGAKVKSTG